MVSIREKKNDKKAGIGKNLAGTLKGGKRPISAIKNCAMKRPFSPLSHKNEISSASGAADSDMIRFSNTTISRTSEVCHPVALSIPISLFLSERPKPDDTRRAGIARAKATVYRAVNIPPFSVKP